MSALTEAEWTTRRAAHTARVEGLVGDYLTDRGHGNTHPVLDFLFTYYSHRPGQLRRWNPGHGIALTGDRACEYAEFASYEQVQTDRGIGYRVRSDLVERRRASIEFILGLLTATAERAPMLGCFGLHEWAMVYRAGAGLTDGFYVYRAEAGVVTSFAKADDEVEMTPAQKRRNRKANRLPVTGTPAWAPPN